MGFRARLIGLTGLALACLSGCLVTAETDFQVEPNVPPVILDTPGTDAPIGSILWLDIEDSSWEFLVRVRDENVEQDLEARWRVVTVKDPVPEFKPQPLPHKFELIRELKITLDQGDLKEHTCHRLELVVSGSFFQRQDLPPELFDLTTDDDASDIAYANWWLWEGEGDADTEDADKLALLNSCEAMSLEGPLAAAP